MRLRRTRVGRSCLPGQYYDQETGLSYNWHRYYDATTGRYLQEEPLITDSIWPESIAYMGPDNPFDARAYTYALSNPVTYVDPDGEVPIVLVGVCALGGCEAAATAAGAALAAGAAALGGYAILETTKELWNTYSKTRAEREGDDRQQFTDEEVAAKARDKSLPGEERRKFQKAEKLRGNRNKQKRGNKCE